MYVPHTHSYDSLEISDAPRSKRPDAYDSTQPANASAHTYDSVDPSEFVAKNATYDSVPVATDSDAAAAAQLPQKKPVSTPPSEASSDFGVFNERYVPSHIERSVSARIGGNGVGGNEAVKKPGRSVVAALYEKIDPADDWNARFQSILEMSERTQEDTNSKYQALAKLSVDFVEMAKTYGKVIIAEHLLPNDKKTIKPIDSLGGKAGGLKYVVRGILFKLAHDMNIRTLDNGRALYVYGGAAGANDELAAKGTGHDLKGAVSYLNYFQTRAALSPDAYKAMGPSVNRVPMQALVDYRGFRLIAMPLLPLSSSSLTYGSGDGGETVHNEDHDAMMESAALYLHLAAHQVQGKMVGSSRVDLQACKLEYSIVSPK